MAIRRNIVKNQSYKSVKQLFSLYKINQAFVSRNHNVYTFQRGNFGSKIQSHVNASGDSIERKNQGEINNSSSSVKEKTSGDSPPEGCTNSKGIATAENNDSEKNVNPYRHAVAWKDPKFYDTKDLDMELRRVFDICHGCRRCFNLCNSFPRLFDMIDESKTGELDSVPSSEFKKVVDDCTLCDMCFLTKCPYTPPHSFNVDFPHLMLRYRAVENKKRNQQHILPSSEQAPVTVKNTSGYLDQRSSMKIQINENVDTELKLEAVDFFSKQITKTDRNGKIGTTLSSISNFVLHNQLIRNLFESVAGVSKEADLPDFSSKQLIKIVKGLPKETNVQENTSRKVVIFATCIGNYNKPDIGLAARSVLIKNGVEVEVDYNQCCGMPQLEHGDLDSVTKAAKNISSYFVQKYIDRGYKVVSIVPSCSLMMKHEWRLLLPEDETVKKLSENTYDISEYVVDIAKKEGLNTKDLKNLSYSVTLQHACHSRAQNIGNKGLEMLKFIPGMKVKVVEKCSGHGGSWGTKKEHHDIAHKVGTPAMKQIVNEINRNANQQKSVVISSECPLAASHLRQGTKALMKKGNQASTLLDDEYLPDTRHPIEILAESYGIEMPTNVK